MELPKSLLKAFNKNYESLFAQNDFSRLYDIFIGFGMKKVLWYKPKGYTRQIYYITEAEEFPARSD